MLLSERADHWYKGGAAYSDGAASERAAPGFHVSRLRLAARYVTEDLVHVSSLVIICWCFSRPTNGFGSEGVPNCRSGCRTTRSSSIPSSTSEQDNVLDVARNVLLQLRAND
jgi:hypothetical protein